MSHESYTFGQYVDLKEDYNQQLSFEFREIQMSRSHLMNHLVHLKDEVNVLKMRLKPSATGHLHTTISVLEERIKEVEKEIKKDE